MSKCESVLYKRVLLDLKLSTLFFFNNQRVIKNLLTYVINKGRKPQKSIFILTCNNTIVLQSEIKKKFTMINQTSLISNLELY